MKWTKKQTQIVNEMLTNPAAKGREIQRRSELAKLLKSLGNEFILNDVTQKNIRPDLRIYATAHGEPQNGDASPFFIETKDIGEIPSFEDIPFRQIFSYIHTNKTRLVRFAVTDFLNWYQFELDGTNLSSVASVYELANFASNEGAWDKDSKDRQALVLLEQFRTATLKIKPLAKDGAPKSATASFANILDPIHLTSSPDWMAVVGGISEADPDLIAKELATIMQPIVATAIEHVTSASYSSKTFKRFGLWVSQRRALAEPLESFCKRDRDDKEEKKLEQLQHEYSWLAAYSLLNILYFVKGLEERKIITPILSTRETLASPVSLFPRLWTWLERPGAEFAKDFIRLQRVYCDWLVQVLEAKNISKLVTKFNSVSLQDYGKSDLLGRLYESLMQQLDSEARKRLGQYYTPRPIAELLWKLAREHLREEGISAEEVTTLDPGTGSGMLLCRGAELLISEMDPDTKRLGQCVRDLAKTSINGLEINPLSSAIARINLYFTYLDLITSRGGNVETMFVSKVSVVELPIFNTDAYELHNEVSGELALSTTVEGGDLQAWKREEAFLSSTKNRSDFLLIIGNPPYCGNDEAVADGRADHLKAWENHYTRRKPNSGIREALLHYMGLADAMLKRGGRGMIAFITSDTWLNNYDHEICRRYFFKHYEPKNVVFLGSSMFDDAKVSTCMVLLQLRKEPISDEQVESIKIKVGSLSVKETPEFRFNELSNYITGATKLKWQTVSPDKFACVRFVQPEDLNIKVETTNIPEIFKFDCPACETGADPYLTSTSKKKLSEKIRGILHSDAPVDLEEGLSGKNISKKVAALRKKRDQLDLVYSPAKIKPYLKFNGSADRYAVPKERFHFVYFEPSLLHRSVMQGEWNPHESGMRIGFNTFESPARAILLPEGQYLHRWQHMRFAPMNVPGHLFEKDSKQTSNLSDKGKALRVCFDSDREFLLYLVGIVNSKAIQAGFSSRLVAHEAPIPVLSSVESIRRAKTISKLSGWLTDLEAQRVVSNEVPRAEGIQKSAIKKFFRESFLKDLSDAESIYTQLQMKLDELVYEAFSDQAAKRKAG